MSSVCCDQLNPLLLEPGLASVLGTRPTFPKTSKHVMSSLGIQKAGAAEIWPSWAQVMAVYLLSPLDFPFQKHGGSQSYSGYATRRSSIFGENLEREPSGLSLWGSLSFLPDATMLSCAQLDIRLGMVGRDHRCSWFHPVLSGRFQRHCSRN